MLQRHTDHSCSASSQAMKKPNSSLSARWHSSTLLVDCSWCLEWGVVWKMDQMWRPPRSPDLLSMTFGCGEIFGTDLIHHSILILFLNWESIWKICYKAYLLKPLRMCTTHSLNAATCALQLKVGILSSCYKFLLCMKKIYIWNIFIHNICSYLWCYLVSLKIGGINVNTLYLILLTLV